jgi:hypothetical protein
MENEVFVLVPRGVYDHGVIGVYVTEDEARAVAAEIWPRTDGHHDFVIYRRVLHAVHDDVFHHTFWPTTALDRGDPRVVLDSEMPKPG